MGNVVRGRPVEAAQKPAEKAMFHGVFTVSATATVVTTEKCSTIYIYPNPGNTGQIYIGAENDVTGAGLSTTNGVLLPSSGIILSANQSKEAVRLYAIGTQPGDTLRYLGVW